MLEGWRWRYSRMAELAIGAAAVVGNRIPMCEEPVDFQRILDSLTHYSEEKD